VQTHLDDCLSHSGSDGVDVWLLDLSCEPDADVLDAEERARGARLLEPAGRRYRSAHTQLRLVLAEHVGRGPAELRFRRAPNGKPELDDPGGLRFNLSHSGDVGLVAVGSDCELGVDVEVLRELDALDQLERRCLSLGERRALQRVAPSERSGLFLRFWARKEAFLKAVGSGLVDELPAIDVTADLVGPCVLLDLDVPGCAAAVAMEVDA
jgi:4'-phosphopantetheinyl transferase